MFLKQRGPRSCLCVPELPFTSGWAMGAVSFSWNSERKGNWWLSQSLAAEAWESCYLSKVFEDAVCVSQLVNRRCSLRASVCFFKKIKSKNKCKPTAPPQAVLPASVGLFFAYEQCADTDSWGLFLSAAFLFQRRKGCSALNVTSVSEERPEISAWVMVI